MWMTLKQTVCCMGRRKMPSVMRATKGWTSCRAMACGHAPGIAPGVEKPLEALIDQLERTKASIRAKVEHPFRVIKQQFGYVKVRYRGLKRNTAQIVTLFALSNLWMARHKLMACMGQVRLQRA